MSKFTRSIVFVILLIAALVVNLPILSMVMNSFKSNTEIMTSRAFFPKHFTWVNYGYVNDKSGFWHQFGNSVIVSLLSLAITILIGALAGYAISRFRTGVSRSFSTLLLLLQMFPIMLIMLPLFLLFKSLHLVDTLAALVIINTAINLAFAALMFKGFFDTIPAEIEEAAWMDGCNRWSTFYRIVLPISGPGIAAVSIFSVLFTWNDYIIANIFIKDQNLMTLPIGLQRFMLQNSTDWGGLTAAATLSAIPVLIFLLFVQKYIAYGASAGSVKG